ncbi:periplasmic nitrate reductase, NapE protein [Marinimicrobium sp. C6131]|uniref:periplasmic nitrate reductase, NapE protein n=1 Tax=Marinimicrobium TaxID=359337 RepID=UPI00223DA109|nr:periplasmic nitrate reductase, NapE protein [Marinimicrobium sp. C6131]UZJ43604.1 periplasmic nitrate reductase, NapE protein [Marinimicrobium sp. C6131]
MSVDTHPSEVDNSQEKRREWRMFAFIVVFLFPILTVALVGAYGFAIWMYQLLAGPPGAG